MGKRIALVLALVFLGGAALGTVWNATYEGVPAGTALASSLDTFIQNFKAEVRQRLEVEHNFGGVSDDNGLHSLGSARCFVQNAAPTDINGGAATRGQWNNGGAGSDGLTTLQTEEQGASTNDLGAGRCWIDLDGPDGTVGTADDRQLNVWDETANAFLPATADGLSGQGLQGSNLVFNGSFDVNDGSTLPRGYTNVNTATLSYTDPTGVTEGEGAALRTAAAGGTDEGVRQTLSNLKASRTYTYRVRVRANANDACNILVDDDTTSATDASATTGVFETLEVSHTTTAVPDIVKFDLRSTDVGDICDWDHVTVFEQDSVVAAPGIQVCFDTNNSTAAAYATPGTWDDALVSCSVTPPGDGYIIQVRGQVVADNEAANPDVLAARIMENATGVSMAVDGADDNNDNANNFEDLAVVPLFFTRINPTPGTTLTYTLQATPTDVGASFWDRNIGDDGADLDGSANLLTTLEVTLIPTR